jgi:secretion/DNA translocation related CpaE-like protein
VNGVTTAVLTVLEDPALVAGADRAAAAAGVAAVHSGVPARRRWLAAAAVLVDEGCARCCLAAGLPRRDHVVLAVPGVPTESAWAAAVELGARQVCGLPDQEPALVRALFEAAEQGSGAPAPGPVLAVVAGRGGAGASVFSAALAQSAPEALLVDLDTVGGGLDLLLGAESEPGLRWPDLGVHDGKVSWSAVRDVLPHRLGVRVLSCGRAYFEIDPAPAAAVVDAGRRGGATVVCDVPRQLTAAGVRVLELADLVVVLTPCDVRGFAAAAATVGVVGTVNPGIGLVVRGPAPGGLSPDQAVAAVGAPLLAGMRPEPMLAQRLDRGGLRLRRGSPLSAAARSVLAAVPAGAGVRAA